MLQYFLTGIAGIVLGIVGMRVWNMRERETSPAAAGEGTAEPAAGTAPSDPQQNAAMPRKMLIGASALVALAIGIFAFKGDDKAAAPQDSAIAGAPGADGKAPVGDVDSMIDKLAQRLAKEPNDGEGFRMLGWSYLMTGHPEKAIAPYQRAIALLPTHANTHAGLGEAMTAIASGRVTDEAKTHFDRSIALDRTEPRARFFEAQWLAQHGQPKQALDQWIDLANSAPADAPWQTDLRRQISDTAGKMGVDVGSRLKQAAPVVARSPATEPPPLDSGTVKAASALPAGDRQAMVDQMVEGLAAKLAANPKDADGWIRLLRSRMVLQQAKQATKDLGNARRGLAGSPDLARVEAAASEFAVPGHK